jgi:peptidoglycan-associated lipoprotein
MKLRTLSTLLLAAVLAAGMVGCKKKMDRVTPLPGYGGGSRIGDAPGDGLSGRPLNPTEDPNANPVTSFNPNDTIPLTGARSIEGRPQDREKYRAQTVYFDFDRSTVKAGEASKVQEVATRFRNEDPNTDLLIEGHCDERGTEEYNRALGERRALALRELLVASGVPADRIHTVSFGKDKPADPEHNDAAWAKNRRGEFILVLPR